MNSYAPSVDSTAASVDVSMVSTSLLADMYKPMMLQGALASGAASRHSVFGLFGRRLPGSRRFDVVADAGRLLDTIEAFTFTPTQIDFLYRTGVVNDETLDFLRDYHFSGTIRSYAEGECYFAGSPLLAVEGAFAEAYILETLALSVYDYDCAVATAASRMAIATYRRPCVDFRVRRTHEQATVATAGALVVGGFVGTSDLKAGLLYGIPTVGTSAHSFTLLHDAEEETFAARVASLGPSTTVLVDTCDIATDVEQAVKATRIVDGELGAVRLDPGDLIAETFKVHTQLNALGATSTGITVINDLDEHAITAPGTTPVDSYGVSTKPVTNSGHPTAALVYKLVERKGADGTMEEIVKFSSGGRSTVDGRRWAGRILSSEDTVAEELVVAFSPQGEGVSVLSQANARPLQVLPVDEGRIIEEHRGEEASSAAAERHRASHAELPYDAWRLSDGKSALPTRYVDLDGRGATRR